MGLLVALADHAYRISGMVLSFNRYPEYLVFEYKEVVQPIMSSRD